MCNLLEIKDLTVHYETVDGVFRAVQGLNLSLKEGETLGLVGETGAGKTTTMKSIMRILPEPPAKLKSGQILFEGEDLLSKPIKEMRNIRGKSISMIFQDPMTSLNPIMSVGSQIAEVIALHSNVTKHQAAQEAAKMLETVGIKAERANDYPHQFSGGMKQRVVIAMALACNPKLLIADEPTTALDVTVQQQILDLINDVVAERDMALILISHDLGVISQNVDDMLVMYGGQVVESGPTAALFRHMAHPYTRGLMAARPRLDAPRQPSGKPMDLLTIPGSVPPLRALPRGCTFADRCSFAEQRCFEERPTRVGIPSFQPHEAEYSSLRVHQVRCLRPEAMRPGNTEAWK